MSADAAAPRGPVIRVRPGVVAAARFVAELGEELGEQVSAQIERIADAKPAGKGRHARA